MGQKKTSILTQIGRFRTVTPVRIHWWLWNDVQSVKQHRRGALSFFKVIRQISRSHGTKNRHFWPELNVSGLLLRCEFTTGFEAWCNIEQVPYYFSRSSIKFQSHTGWKIDGLDQIWARLLGRSQLSNPSDLSCFVVLNLFTRTVMVLLEKVANCHKCDGNSMKYEGNIKIFNYIISDYLWSYGDHSILTLLIHLSIIYLFVCLIHNISPVSLVFSESLSPDKTSTREPLSRGVFLTLHYHMHFINKRN